MKCKFLFNGMLPVSTLWVGFFIFFFFSKKRVIWILFHQARQLLGLCNSDLFVKVSKPCKHVNLNPSRHQRKPVVTKSQVGPFFFSSPGAQETFSLHVTIFTLHTFLLMHSFTEYWFLKVAYFSLFEVQITWLLR